MTKVDRWRPNCPPLGRIRLNSKVWISLTAGSAEFFIVFTLKTILWYARGSILRRYLRRSAWITPIFKRLCNFHLFQQYWNLVKNLLVLLSEYYEQGLAFCPWQTSSVIASWIFLVYEKRKNCYDYLNKYAFYSLFK